MEIVISAIISWFIFRCLITGFYVIQPDERAVKTSFGKAKRLKPNSAKSELLNAEERQRYDYPALEVIEPGGPYFKWPWERVHKVSISTKTVNMAYDPDNAKANHNNQWIDAVTKDQLNIGLTGEIRYRVSEKNLYASIFAIKDPIAHVMGYFVAVLRERISNFEAPMNDSEDENGLANVEGISINDLRKNLRDLNDHMDNECRVSSDRYGIELDASLIIEINPPQDVDSALAAINIAHNEVSSDISLAKANADERIVQSKKAVEIETLRAEGEVQKLVELSKELSNLKASGGKHAIASYVKNVNLSLIKLNRRIVRRSN